MIDYDDYWIERENKTLDYYKNLYEPIKEELTPEEKHTNILDVGGGSGAFLKYLGIKNATVIDISKSGLNHAKKMGYTIIKADCQKSLPLNNNSYDVVYCLELLEHLKDSNTTIKEIYRVLKKSGIAIFEVPNIWREKLDDHHVKHWKYKELKNKLENVGFEIKWVFKCPRLKDSKLRIITQNISKIFPDIFASFFIIKAVKPKDG